MRKNVLIWNTGHQPFTDQSDAAAKSAHTVTRCTHRSPMSIHPLGQSVNGVAASPASAVRPGRCAIVHQPPPAVKLAFEFLVLTAARFGEVRLAT